MLNHKELEEKRKELAFDIDGIVYKVNDLIYKKDLVLLLMHPDGR
jgi:DNA ligase (NAD+)